MTREPARRGGRFIPRTRVTARDRYEAAEEMYFWPAVRKHIPRGTGVAVVIDLGDTFVGHSSRVLSLVPEPGQHVGILGELRAQQLDRHRPGQDHVCTRHTSPKPPEAIR
jgi:hypothetical protein